MYTLFLGQQSVRDWASYLVVALTFGAGRVKPFECEWPVIFQELLTASKEQSKLYQNKPSESIQIYELLNYQPEYNKTFLMKRPLYRDHPTRLPPRLPIHISSKRVPHLDFPVTLIPDGLGTLPNQPF